MKNKKVRIVEFDDGDHEPKYFFEDGDFIIGRLEFIRFLCDSHLQDFVFMTVCLDDFDEYTDNYDFLCMYEDQSDDERIKNFDRLYDIYKKKYHDEYKAKLGE